MSDFTLYFETGASLSITVEADDLESAVEKAYDEIPRGVCAQCSGGGQSWGLELGDWELDEKAAAEDYPS